MSRIPGDRLCSVFCEQIEERHVGTQTRRQERLENGRGVVASAAVEKEEKEEKRRRRKTRKRSSSREAESIVTFFLCLSPCKSPSSLFFFPFLFFSFLPQISYRCTMRYLLPSQSHHKRTGSYSGVLHCCPPYISRTTTSRFALLIMCLAIINR